MAALLLSDRLDEPVVESVDEATRVEQITQGAERA
jgi:hypothetical protein